MAKPQLVFNNWTETRNPAWAKETPNFNNLVIAGAILDVAAFEAALEDVVVTTSAAAAAGATTLAVNALSGPIPVGTILDFTGAGKFAQLTAAAAAGATSLTVEAIPTALAAGDTATYVGTDAAVTIPGGTLVGRTRAEAEADAPFGPAVVGTDDEVYLTYHGIYDARDNDEVTLYRHGRVVAYNKLDGWANLTAAEQTWIHDNYQTILAAE